MQNLSILHPPFLLGLITGGAVIYWFTGASMQAVTTGAYRAVEFIKANIKLEGATKASVADSKKVVEICTQYAQKGMLNIFLGVFFSTLAFAFVEPFFFIGYLISIALFGLYQAIFMANAGGAWDNAKKIVETELKMKGTPLHDASIVGDTVGDPFKDTTSVALNPVIKFTTLFGLLAVELGVYLTAEKGAGLTQPWPRVVPAVGRLRLPVVLRHAHRVQGGLMRLLPRDEQFFELFTQVAQRGVEAARQLGELLASDGDRRAYLVESISRIELEADKLTHDVTVRLDRSFITPLDREDIHFLASSLDNIIDRIDGIARRTKIFRVGASPRGAVLLAEVIHRAALQLLAAVKELGGKKQDAILAACLEVRRLEEEGDALYHEWLGFLFEHEANPLEVIKWKEIYDKLENTLDSAEDVSNTLESVAIKHG